MTNAAWPGYVKIGRAIDPFDRLYSYQTGDPMRAYQLEHYRYFPDRYDAEDRVKKLLVPWWVVGEWYRLPLADVIHVIKRIEL